MYCIYIFHYMRLKQFVDKCISLLYLLYIKKVKCQNTTFILLYTFHNIDRLIYYSQIKNLVSIGKIYTCYIILIINNTHKINYNI